MQHSKKLTLALVLFMAGTAQAGAITNTFNKTKSIITKTSQFGSHHVTEMTGHGMNGAKTGFAMSLSAHVTSDLLQQIITMIKNRKLTTVSIPQVNNHWDAIIAAAGFGATADILTHLFTDDATADEITKLLTALIAVAGPAQALIQ